MKEFNENEELNINGNIAPGNNISEVDKRFLSLKTSTRRWNMQMDSDINIMLPLTTLS